MRQMRPLREPKEVPISMPKSSSRLARTASPSIPGGMMTPVTFAILCPWSPNSLRPMASRPAVRAEALRLDPSLDVLARKDRLDDTLVERDRRRSRRSRQAFLEAGGDGVDLPSVHHQIHAADGRCRIHVKQRAPPPADGADLF